MPVVSPKISVIMPVHNADPYLEESVNSILNQTFKNFEFIIICSDPSEKTKKILDKYQSLDSRILVIYQEKKGIIFARNTGCQLAKGEFIAVMDADDISYPERFEKQLLFMEKHPDIGIVGSWADFINQSGLKIYTVRSPTNPFLIGWKLLFSNCILHLTILMRTKILKELNYYTPEMNGFPEDYDLWTRAFFITKIANIPASLTQYRLHSTNNSISVNSEIIQFCHIIRNNMLQKILGPELHEFLESTGLSMNSDLLSFNLDYIDNQVKVLENLFTAYITQFEITPEDIPDIKSDLAMKIYTYSCFMIIHSKIRGLVLLCKALHYSKSTVIIKLIKKIGGKVIYYLKIYLNAIDVEKKLQEG